MVDLRNESGKYPTVMSVVADPDNKAVKITVQGSGFSLPLPVALDNEVRQLEKHMKGCVFDISFGSQTTQAQFNIKFMEGNK